MQNRILRAATVLSFVVALTITSAVAPAAAHTFDSISVDIPFGFSDGQREFPAGKYTVLPAASNTRILTVGRLMFERRSGRELPNGFPGADAVK